MTSNVYIHGSPNDQIAGPPAPHSARWRKTGKSGHHNLGLVHELMAQKAGRQELTEAVWIILASFVWPTACRLLLKILLKILRWNFPLVVPCRSRFPNLLYLLLSLQFSLLFSHLFLFLCSFLLLHHYNIMPQNMDATLLLMPHKYSVNYGNYCSQVIISNTSQNKVPLLQQHGNCNSKVPLLQHAQSTIPSDS